MAVRVTTENSGKHDPVAVNSPPDDVADRYVGQWNRLVSTTNWEKGRIICQWRDALSNAGAAVTEYSDESWSERVGGVSSQHVGRLRRTYQRFGDVYTQYEGLYWSHFQAGLDWDDAEMWLEGAIQNEWSVSQMRGKRWETVGTPGEPLPPETMDDDQDAPAETSKSAVARPAAVAAAKATLKEPQAASRDHGAPEGDDEPAAAEPTERAQKKPAAPQRLGVEVDQLPDDLADAFEQFKLAIIAHRRNGWVETNPEMVVECLDALRELTLRPAE